MKAWRVVAVVAVADLIAFRSQIGFHILTFVQSLPFVLLPVLTGDRNAIQTPSPSSKVVAVVVLVVVIVAAKIKRTITQTTKQTRKTRKTRFGKTKRSVF